MTSRLKVVVWNLLVLAVLLAGFELFVRWRLSHNNAFAERAFYNLGYYPSGFSRQVLKPGQEIFAVDAEGRVDRGRRRYRINVWGWRGEDWPLAKEPGELRVVIAGGSHVFDLECLDHDGCPGWPALVESELAALLPGKRVRVFNGGAPGQDSRSFPAQLALEWPRFAPDVVVLDSTWNDLKWITRLAPADSLLAVPPGAPPNPLIDARPGLDAYLGWSMVYRKVRDRFWERALDLHERQLEGSPADPGSGVDSFTPGFEQYARNLRAAVLLARAAGARPLLAIEERLIAPDNTEEEKARILYSMVATRSAEEVPALYLNADARIRQVGAELDVPVLDLNPALAPDRAKLFKDHVHTTPAGSRRLAELYARYLADLLEDG